MPTEQKQMQISGGGTATVTTSYSVPFTTAQGATWQHGSAAHQLTFVVVKRRIPNLHAGAAWMSPDFDAPLSEDFLITGE